ncbi:MAG TPA: AraC family transcriptional regulator [Chloroflexota bacterium]
MSSLTILQAGAPTDWHPERNGDVRHLLATYWSVEAIAREVGFANGSYLALHFKRRIGMSPRQYRSGC